MASNISCTAKKERRKISHATQWHFVTMQNTKYIKITTQNKGNVTTM